MPKKVAFRLTPLAIKRHSKAGLVADGGGLYLQTSQSKAKSWIFRYRLGGKDRAHGLGSVDTISLEKARTEALRCRQLVREGVDPIEERRVRVGAAIASQSISQTFRETAEAFIGANEAGWRNAKHAGQWRSTLATYCYPKIGAIPVRTVQTAHVLQCIEPIWGTKPETASRLRGRIEQVLDYAKARELRNGENPARWKGHIDQILPARADVQPVKHHEAMPYREVPAFYARLALHEGIGPIALRFLILSCARTNETLGAHEPEFDLRRGIWLIPAARMKSKREWRVPLARQAIDLVKLAIAEADEQGIDRQSDLVFVNPRGRHLSNMALLQLMRRMEVDAVPHGFRSSFRDWCAETQNFAHEIVEMALAHAVGSKVELAYRRSDMVEKRRNLGQAWANFVTSKASKARAAA